MPVKEAKIADDAPEPTETASPAPGSTMELGDMVFIYIGNEEYRAYEYGNGRTLPIQQPAWLNVKRKPEGDSHRIITKDGTSVYVPVGWIGIHWKSDPPFHF